MNAQDFIPTPEQCNALERCLDAKGKPYYTARSATDPDSTYYVRWKPGHYWPSCSCRDGGLKCWHAAVAHYLEAQYQESVETGELEAQTREAQAVKQYGAEAYQCEPFSLLKTA